MDFAYSEEQEAFRETLRRFLAERSPTAEVFRLMETEAGYDPAVWKQMGEELGLPGIAVPEAYGGQGFGFLELGIALEETGRALLCAPFFSTACLATSAILSCGSEADRADLLPGIASGGTLATLALAEPRGDWRPESVATTARPDGDAWTLDGAKAWVTDGHVADLLLVAARLPGSAGADGLCLAAVRTDAAGLTVAPTETLDPTRKQAAITFAGARGRLLGEPGGAGPGLARTLDRAVAGLAAEMAGGAGRCLDQAVAYARERRQFGRPIGGFQAVKHKAAEVLLEVESAKAASAWACWAAAEDNEERSQAAHLAKAFCADAYLRAAGESIQIHGGVGFTWEAAPHLYYRRARVSEVLFGDSRHHRVRLAAGLGLRS